MTRLLVVGCGEIAMAAHLPAALRLQDEGLVEVIACDADAAKRKKAASQLGVPVVADAAEAFESVDAVAICVPPGPNADLAIAAAERGLHVLCEKPPGRDARQAEHMASAAAAHPEIITMVAFNRRYLPLYQRAVARSADLGPPTAFFGRFSRPGMGGQPSNTATDWLTSDSIHVIDLAIATMGHPTAVGVDRRVVGAGAENVWTLQLHADHGSAVLLFHYAAGRRTERYEWSGPGYDVCLDVPGVGEAPPSLEWAVAGRRVDVETADSAEDPASFGFVDEYRAFAGAIAGTAPRPAADFAHGAALMRLIATILETPPGRTATVVGPALPAKVAPAAVAEPVAAGPSEDRPTVVLAHPVGAQPAYFPAALLAALGARCSVQTASTEADLEALLATARVLVTGRGAIAPPADLLARAPHLELLVSVGASVRALDPNALLERGVVLCNTAEAVAKSVAEHCLMVTLAGLRQLVQNDAAMRRGQWPRPGAWRRSTGAPTKAAVLRKLARRLPVPAAVKQPAKRQLRRGRAVVQRRRGGVEVPVEPTSIGSDLAGQTVGLVGWSHTARHFVALLAPFGCEILVHSDGASDEELNAAGVRRAAIGELLGASRVVSLHRGLTEQTTHYLDADRLDRIGSGAVLINTARGELIDEAALLRRLQRRDIIAALDVFEGEPLAPDHPLRHLPNVILTPHNASTTSQETLRMGAQALDTILDWVEGRPVDALRPERLARMS